MNQNKNTASSEKKKMILVLAVSVLTALTAGILLAFQLHSKEETHTLEDILPETSEETSILETELSAAGSVQKEITDMISESAKESASEAVMLTEYITEQEVSISESLSEVQPASEMETAVSTEALQTAPAVETQVSVTTEEAADEPELNTTATMTEHITVTSAVVPSTETVTESVTETSVPSEKKTYRSVLEHIFKYHRFQEDEFSIVNDSDIYENEFAVYDVDNDGVEELIIRWANASVASVAGIVYSYDSEGNICRKLKTTPYLRFYSNGVIEADAVHHSTLAGDFWAYSLYQYDNTEGLYKEAGYVDAWDKSVAEEDWYAQETFPDYADISNTGRVYFIFSDYDEIEGVSDPMDVTEYQTWHDSYIGSASEVNIPFRKMTEANIEQINC